MVNERELEIVRRFQRNVYGREPDTSGLNQNHNGCAGHWLETQMGISHNANNEADLLGYEMKNHTTSGKTTFGDWSADYYIFTNNQSRLSRTQFIEIFGKPNAQKNERYSWSGEPIPTIHRPSSWNGSEMLIDENDTIKIVYNYSRDPRHNKEQIVPIRFQQENLTLASWSRAWLEPKLTNKFGQNGWFKCLQDDHGIYHKIVFGEPMSFDNWLNLVQSGVIFFDSGMYVGNARNYSLWRANNSYWDSLVVREYPPFPQED
ncbi:TPA: LlaMI family restriction endonuclease [Neisseria meningitidis]|uniref:LlaMI family restriction endonuclease n=1 Tax=Neisseria TaxID=482 RepID=UPI0002E88E29|nr:LlaMI family restriction endonuclease [Neisseria meningitidis]MBS0040050.1 LlaMI family restriction endonuclease [Neisseria sp. Marseille-Q1983]MBW3924659.1 LlaMI family restriction endonuclease [Neisseria meningitidis]SPY05408.1 LlaMI restriction endonuclease [Neisseria meningitidis]